MVVGSAQICRSTLITFGLRSAPASMPTEYRVGLGPVPFIEANDSGPYLFLFSVTVRSYLVESFVPRYPLPFAAASFRYVSWGT